MHIFQPVQYRKNRLPSQFHTGFFSLFLTLALLASLPKIEAHGDLNVQLAQVNGQLEREPNNPELLMKRGLVYGHFEKFDEAMADFERCLAREPQHTEVLFAKGRTCHEAGWNQSALVLLDRYLESKPKDPLNARLIRARTLVQLDRAAAAVEDLSAVIAELEKPKPDFYIERAIIQAGLGGENVDPAIAGLEEGLRKIGPLVTLQNAALELEIEHKKFDAALRRVDTLIESSRRRDRWLARKAEILEQAGRPDDAVFAWSAALSAIDGLSSRQQNTPATVKLREWINARLKALAPASPSQVSAEVATETPLAAAELTTPAK